MRKPLDVSIVVVKVGGSLYDWPQLGTRLREYLGTFRGRSIVLVPGGGPFANVIRSMDETHRLGEERAHWLALQSLALAAHFLEQLLPGAKVIDGISAARNSWVVDRASILNIFRFARGDESRPHHLPHRWSATSDSFAARVAIVARAERLILLKSSPPSADSDWTVAARLGHVDALFPATIAEATFPVEMVNLRDWQPNR
jgi:aspartokinase-like uncharacterized kinase